MELDVKFSKATPVNMVVEFTESSEEIDAGFGEIQTVSTSTLPEYKGDYAITPSVSGQTMPTRGKAMREDVMIRPIPIFNVSNNSGGSTVYIAKEI